MCGRESELYKAIIEGTEMHVCSKCSRYGKVIKKIVAPMVEKKLKTKQVTKTDKEIVQMLDPNYAQIIKSKREQLGMKQEELAKKISEKLSLIHNIESGRYGPSIDLARKLEKFLKVKIIKQQEMSKHLNLKSDSDKLTLGDLIKTKH
jgi:putative transcription factor